ncbi:MAG TPA: SRPBCC domain-containing protein [Candidatus Limnocylindrales bacterium]
MDDRVFRALADPSRRYLLDRLFERDGQTLTELERSVTGMTRFGVMKHLGVLEEAELVTTRRVGREKLHYLNPVPIQQIHERWLDRYRARATQALLDLRTTLEASSMNAMLPTDAPPAHVTTVYIRATPEAIWRAITESEFTLRYYYSSTVESDWKPGSPLRYAIGDNDAIVGQILEADPPRRLVTTFDARWDDQVAQDAPTRISWEIEPDQGGVTRLTVVHDGFPARTTTYEQVAGGMPFILSGLKTLLETGEPLAPSTRVMA